MQRLAHKETKIAGMLLKKIKLHQNSTAMAQDPRDTLQSKMRYYGTYRFTEALSRTVSPLKESLYICRLIINIQNMRRD